MRHFSIHQHVDAGGPLAVESDALGPRAGHHAHVRTPARRIEEGARRTLAFAAPDVVAVISDARPRLFVEFAHAFQLQRLTRGW